MSLVASERVDLGGVFVVWGYVWLETRGVSKCESMAGERSDSCCEIVRTL